VADIIPDPDDAPEGRDQRAAADPAADETVPEAPAGDPEAEHEDADSGRTPLAVGIGALDESNAGPGAAAFFDVDNTMMKGSSAGLMAKGMADRDYFTTAEIIDFSWKQLKFVLTGRENMGDIAQATENGLAFVKGRSPDDLRELAAEVYDERMINRLWSGTVDLARAHQEVGHEVWLISATPVEVASTIADRLGLTGGLGTIAEVVDGVYTGKLVGPPLHGPAKVARIKELAEARGLDLARCAAYSDSSNDIPMLSAVGFPVAVNPDGRLRSYAREHDWPVRDYRIRSTDAVRRGVPAAAAGAAAIGVAVGVAKAISVVRSQPPTQ
jgi:HAD superfamily hydrolase (TIGR01490 family)